jgi:hypothetical protein
MTASATNVRRAYWLKTLHQWHWISSAICLLGMLLFAITGITLNHAAQVDTPPKIVNKTAQVSDALLQQLNTLAAEADESTPLPAGLKSWASDNFATDIDENTSDTTAEWSDRELYISMQRPGGDSWLSINLRNGAAKYQNTTRGWIAYLNDLHKARHTGAAWGWFIDVFAAACVIFSVTGLFILKMHAGNRPSTWPLVGLGVLIPLLLAILSIH